MIEIKVRKKGEAISFLEVKGHAGYDDSGKDLVCAGVSCIMYGVCNALDGMPDVEIDLEEVITIYNHSQRQDVRNYLELALIQLETVAYSYPDHVKITKE